MKVLYTGGSFSMFHAGHANFLRQCKKLAEKVVVSLNTDEFIQRYKGSLPIDTYDERRNVLLSCKYVDEVIPNENGEDSKPSILKVKPHIIVIGDDWAKRDYYAQMNFTQEFLDENDILLCYIPYTKGISTSEIKKRILNQ